MVEQITGLLVIEDKPITRAQLMVHFEYERYRAFARADAEGIEQLIITHQVDICLLDINVTGRDGHSRITRSK